MGSAAVLLDTHQHQTSLNKTRRQQTAPVGGWGVGASCLDMFSSITDENSENIRL